MAVAHAIRFPPTLEDLERQRALIRLVVDEDHTARRICAEGTSEAFVAR